MMKTVLSRTSEYFDFLMIDSFRNDDDYLAILILMGMLFLVFAVILTTVLIIIFVGILLALVGAGIISASVLVGLQQRSLNRGLKTLFLMASMLGFSIISVIFFWFANQVRDWFAGNFAVGWGWCRTTVGLDARNAVFHNVLEGEGCNNAALLQTSDRQTSFRTV